MGLLFTIITGLFFLLGIFLNKICKDKKNISVLSISLAFIVLLNLVFLDIAPEIYEHLSFNNIIVILLGLIILKVMDFIVPHHHHNHKEKNDNIKEHNNHLEHIGIITILALVLHNIIECMALYNLTLDSTKSGLLMCCGIALHNIPLGFQIGNNIKNNRLLYIILLTISGFAGGILAFYMGTLSEAMEMYILCFTFGMLIYLTFFELLKEVWESKKNIYSLLGLIIGVLIIMLSRLI